MKHSWLFVFLGGGFGSVCRYYISIWLTAKSAGSIPWGTFVSNILACLILGLAVARYTKGEGNSNEFWMYLVAVGFCGGFSTFSTFSKENFELLNNGQYGMLSIYVIVSLIVGVLGFIAGHYVGS